MVRKVVESDIYEFLKRTFRDVFGRDVVPSPELTAKDVPGWDSFAQISIVVATEEEFGFEFTTSELDGFHTVGDYVNVVLARVNV